MGFGELAGDDGLAIAENGKCILECAQQAVRRFVEDESGLLGGERFERLDALTGPSGKEPGIQKRVSRQAGGDDGRIDSAGSRDGDYADARCDRGLDDALAGVGDSGQAGVGNDRHGLTC